MTLYFIKESDSFAKTTKDIAILLHAHKQQFFGSPKTPDHNSSSKITPWNDKISLEILY